jgi:hypothetical protein
MSLSIIEEEREENTEDCLDRSSSSLSRKSVTFFEKVGVISIDRMSKDEIDDLFWRPDDYVRCRSEDQIISTRKARSRVREMRRRVSQRQSLAVKTDMTDGVSLEKSQVTLDRTNLKKERIFTTTA